MGFWKNIAENIVRRAGYSVPTDLTSLSGLKNNTNRTGAGFGGVLANMQQNGMQAPNPPAPPSDPSDLEAQRKYNDALLLYNQKYRNYQSQVMTMFMQRFNMMQQAILMTQRNQQQSTARQGVSNPLSNPGVGGILSSDSDV